MITTAANARRICSGLVNRAKPLTADELQQWETEIAVVRETVAAFNLRFEGLQKPASFTRAAAITEPIAAEEAEDASLLRDLATRAQRRSGRIRNLPTALGMDAQEGGGAADNAASLVVQGDTETAAAAADVPVPDDSEDEGLEGQMPVPVPADIEALQENVEESKKEVEVNEKMEVDEEEAAEPVSNSQDEEDELEPDWQKLDIERANLTAFGRALYPLVQEHKKLAPTASGDIIAVQCKIMDCMWSEIQRLLVVEEDVEEVESAYEAIVKKVAGLKLQLASHSASSTAAVAQQ
eukprot:TRINITY_DN1028_c0_g2_i1.p1 TRINITY_DN1028_c0_g2~~TRINITY_DN1028_c0_g2_i1.p1  ORF type:complete len:295 (-),score=96.40 TRINITY_DN1028_c0_g2_i1:240-1124(-)